MIQDVQILNTGLQLIKMIKIGDMFKIYIRILLINFREFLMFKGIFVLLIMLLILRTLLLLIFLMENLIMLINLMKLFGMN